jgi:HK97 family phage major capsid protein
MGSSVKSYLEGQVNARLADASAIAEKAESEGRDMSSVEKAECKSLLDEVQKIKGQVAEIDERESLMKTIEEIRGPAVTRTEKSMEGLSLGEAFVQSDGYKAIIESGLGGQWTTGAIELPAAMGAKSLRSGSKATVTEAASAIVPYDFRPEIQSLPVWPLTIADLIPQGQTNSTQVTYVQELSETNAAAATLEGTAAYSQGAKPESTIVFTTVNAAVKKVATFLPVSDEMLEDVAAMQSYLNGRLSLFVQQAEEADLLSTISGTSGIQTATASVLDSDSGLDALYRAAVAVRVTGGLEASAIVMHPTDWANTRLQKDLNAQYFGGGPFTMGPYGAGGPAGMSSIGADNLWGIPVVTTTAASLGTVWVGAFRTGAFIFRRRGLTVEASNSHDKFFQYNLTAIRAEERYALAVYRPSAFFKVTAYAALVHS